MLYFRLEIVGSVWGIQNCVVNCMKFVQHYTFANREYCRTLFTLLFAHAHRNFVFLFETTVPKPNKTFSTSYWYFIFCYIFLQIPIQSFKFMLLKYRKQIQISFENNIIIHVGSVQYSIPIGNNRFYRKWFEEPSTRSIFTRHTEF